MRVAIPKFLTALSHYFLYYARLFPLYFSFQVLGVGFGLLTIAALAGIHVLPGVDFSLLLMVTCLAYPLVVNVLRACRLYYGVSADNDGTRQVFSGSHALDSTFITTKIRQISSCNDHDMSGSQYLIFDTEKETKHLAMWSAQVNRELFFNDSVVDRWRFRVNNSLNLSRLKSIIRDWKRRGTLLMFYLVDGVNKGKILSDNRKIGLSGDLVAAAGDICLDVFPVSFFDNLLTSGAAGKILMIPSLGECLDFRKLFPVEDGGVTLKELSCSYELANYIGVSTLLVSGNHQKYLYIPRQSALNHQSSGLLAPSGSGSLDWGDLARPVDYDGVTVQTYSLRSTVVSGMERELREELQNLVDFDLKNSGLNTQIIGYFRMYERAGKPEFVGISVVGGICDRSFDTHDSAEVNSLEKLSFSNIGELRIICEQLLEKRVELSVPLRMSLIFLCTAMDDEEGGRRLTQMLWW
jgi:hypothetical protein